MSYFLQNIVIALNDGSTYALIALGYTMVYGVLRLINFAHGDVFMLGAFVGAYTAYALVFNPGMWTYSAILYYVYGRAFSGLLIAGIVLGGLYFTTEWGSRTFLRIPRRLSVLTAAAIASALAYFAFAPMHNWTEQTSPITDSPKQGIFDAFIGITAAMCVCGAIGYCIERFAYRPLRRSPKLSALITAIGVSLLIEYLAQIQWHVNGVVLFGPSPQRFPPIAGSEDDIAFFTKYFGIRVNGKDMIVIGTCLVTLFILRFIVLHTRQGKAMRAVSLNYDSAQLMGININRVISFTFVLGSMLAGLGGCLYGLNYEQCLPLMGLTLGLKAFVAAVIGGIGNIPGAAIGGFTIALIETFVSTIHYHNSAIVGPYRDAIAFVILIAVLLVRPEGIFGKAVAEKV